MRQPCKVTSGANLILGNQSTSSGNLLSVAAATVTATNAFGTGTLDVRRGSVDFKGGLITADRLLSTNAQSSFTFNGGTLITRSATLNNGQDFVIGANAGTGPAGAGFTNSTAISLPAFAATTPYPSTISVANVAGTVSRVTVTIKNLSHTASGELSVLLVGPNGAAVMLMSAAGFTSAGNNVTLTFDDAAINPTPIFTALTNGTYFPTNYSSIGLPAPAPSSPYSTQLASFNGSDANGNWSLFVYDAQPGNGGSIAGGWSLKLETTTPPPSTWDVRSNAAPTVVSNNLIVGSSAANATLLITNGATLSTGNLQSDASRLGMNVSSSNNLAVIANPGSLWINSGSIHVGEFGSFNSLLVTNGGRLVNNFGYRIGRNPGANNNQVVVSGLNSELDALFLYAGDGGSFNTLLITNGGRVVNDSARIGLQIGANSNQVIVSGLNSEFETLTLYSGYSGSFNTLLITNGGRVVNATCSIGYASEANSNQVIVSGPNSKWDNSDYLDVGDYGSFNTLLITNGGVVQAASAYVGLSEGGSNNLLSLGNGTLIVTNVSGNAVLEVSSGSLVFNGGTITADQLLLTNGALSTFNFNTGTLYTRAAAVANGSLFTVGNGSSPATYNMSGTATNLHSFADGFNVPANASLTGNGTISGTLVISSGGTLAPGTSFGKIILKSSPYLQGTLAMEIGKFGSALTNDQLQVTGPFIFGGFLSVTKIGFPTTLASGDSFKLFNAGTYLGSFSSITLPSLAPGLSWSNTLSLNGTITVTGSAIIPPPSISSLAKTGTNLIFNITGGAASGSWNLLTSTNVALPLAGWTTNRSGAFDGSGNVNFTNGINAAEPQRYFRIKTP